MNERQAYLSSINKQEGLELPSPTCQLKMTPIPRDRTQDRRDGIITIVFPFSLKDRVSAYEMARESALETKWGHQHLGPLLQDTMSAHDLITTGKRLGSVHN